MLHCTKSAVASNQVSDVCQFPSHRTQARQSVASLSSLRYACSSIHHKVTNNACEKHTFCKGYMQQ